MIKTLGVSSRTLLIRTAILRLGKPTGGYRIHIAKHVAEAKKASSDAEVQRLQDCLPRISEL